MNLGLDMSLKLQQKLSFQMIQSLKLLQVNTLQLEQMLKTELEMNPVLEATEELEQEVDETPEEEQKEEKEDEEELQTSEDEIDWEEYLEEGFDLGYSFNEERDPNEEKYEASPVYQKTLEEHLINQCPEKKIPEKLELIVQFLIGSLDNDGYLRLAINDIADYISASVFDIEEALHITRDTVLPLGEETVSLNLATGRIVAENLISGINSPSINASLKDGYAVVSEDLDGAGPKTPVTLSLVEASSAAGGDTPPELSSGSAMRILTGARIPEGATAVIAEEFTSLTGKTLRAENTAEAGRNIMPLGTDVARGQCVAEKGSPITPGLAGIIAAAGFSNIPVFKQPRVTILATGDEVVAPGKPLPPGKLYASNMITLGAFCRKWGMETRLLTVEDDPDKIYQALETALASSDAVITSGGAWTGDRDLVAKILVDLGWKKAFHRIRIGPGKAVGFGMKGSVPVFILPGGPPSNLMGFLQIALPGLHVLSGCQRVGLPVMHAIALSEMRGRARDWTQFVFGKVASDENGLWFDSLGQMARLQSMADASAVAMM